MRPRNMSTFCFVYLYFMGNLLIVFCASSRNLFNINTAKHTPVLHSGTDNFANIIAKVLRQQRVEPLFFQLSSRYESDAKYSEHDQRATPFEARTANAFPHLVTPKATKAVEIDVDDTETKVLDGVDASKGEFPYIVSIKRGGTHYCGGSIIDATHILTAAHCFEDDTGNDFELDPTEYSVAVGEYDLRVKDRYEQSLMVEHICVHQNFTPISLLMGNDIAIIRLADRIQFFLGIVERARLPPRDGDVVDIRRGTADVVGWGNTGADANGTILNPDVLQTTYVTLYKSKECSFKGVGSSIICAGDDNIVRARDVCGGDSGGPIICSGVVCGLVSYGVRCFFDRKSKRGVYTRVHYFRDWINNYALDGEDRQCHQIT